MVCRSLRVVLLSKPGINTADDAWNGKPDWLDDLIEAIVEHHYAEPTILGGHNAASPDKHLHRGAVAIENEEGGQGGLIRRLSKHGFVVSEIHRDRFYISKLRDVGDGS